MSISSLMFMVFMVWWLVVVVVDRIALGIALVRRSNTLPTGVVATPTTALVIECIIEG